MNPKLAKQAAVVLGWEHHPEIDEGEHGADEYWNTPTGQLIYTLSAVFQLDYLIPEVERWCGEKGCLLELAYGGVDDRGNFDSSWDCAISNSRHSVYAESDDPATAICLALVDADKKLKGEK